MRFLTRLIPFMAMKGKVLWNKVLWNSWMTIYTLEDFESWDKSTHHSLSFGMYFYKSIITKYQLLMSDLFRDFFISGELISRSQSQNASAVSFEITTSVAPLRTTSSLYSEIASFNIADPSTTLWTAATKLLASQMAWLRPWPRAEIAFG
jgi:hypothetical protein